MLDPQGVHDVVVNLQGDFPTVPPEQLRRVIAPLRDPAVDIATLVTPIEDEAEAARRPFAGLADLLKKE